MKHLDTPLLKPQFIAPNGRNGAVHSATPQGKSGIIAEPQPYITDLLIVDTVTLLGTKCNLEW